MKVTLTMYNWAITRIRPINYFEYHMNLDGYTCNEKRS